MQIPESCVFDVPRSRMVFLEAVAQKEREIIVWLISAGAGMRWTAWDGFGSTGAVMASAGTSTSCMWRVFFLFFVSAVCNLRQQKQYLDNLVSRTFWYFGISLEWWFWKARDVSRFSTFWTDKELELQVVNTANDFKDCVFWPQGALKYIYVDFFGGKWLLCHFWI